MEIEKREEIVYYVGNKKFFSEEDAKDFCDKFKKLKDGRKLYDVSVVTNETINLHRFGKSFVASVPSESPGVISLWQYLNETYGSPIVSPMKMIHIPRYEVDECKSFVTIDGIMRADQEIVFLKDSGKVDDELMGIYEEIKCDDINFFK